MSTDNLTSEQKAFLEECALEFSDRFTDSDLEYKKMYDAEIPPPPIMCPWYGKSRVPGNRYRGGGSYHNDSRDNRYDNRDRDWGRRDRDYHRRDRDRDYNSENRDRDYQGDRHNRRFKPY